MYDNAGGIQIQSILGTKIFDDHRIPEIAALRVLMGTELYLHRITMGPFATFCYWDGNNTVLIKCTLLMLSVEWQLWVSILKAPGTIIPVEKRVVERVSNQLRINYILVQWPNFVNFPCSGTAS